jgi:hypothetical protein
MTRARRDDSDPQCRKIRSLKAPKDDLHGDTQP